MPEATVVSNQAILQAWLRLTPFHVGVVKLHPAKWWLVTASGWRVLIPATSGQ